MNLDNLFAVIIGMVFLAVFAVLVILKNRYSESRYDERQLSARNNAYKYSFFVLLFYIILCAVLDVCEIKWAQTSIQMLIGLLLSVVVLTVICIIKDAYFGVSGKLNVVYVLILLAVAVLNGCEFISGIQNDEILIDNGELSMGIFPALLSIVFLAISVAIMVKYTVNKKHTEDE